MTGTIGVAAPAGLGIVGLVLLSFALDGDSFLYAPAAFFIAAAVGFPWLVLRRPGAAWRALQEWERQLRFELTDRSLRVRTERSALEVEWEACTGWLETDEAFYVLRGFLFYILPKSAFDDEDIPRVGELLREKVRLQPETSKRRVTTLLLCILFALIAVAVYRAVLSN